MIQWSAAIYKTDWLHCLCCVIMIALYKYEEFTLSLDFKLNLNIFKVYLIKTILSIKITIYKSLTTSEALFKTVNDFLAVWKDSDWFVNLFKHN